MKYILEIKPEYEDSFKGVMILGAKDSNLFVDTLAADDLEELTADYINEHYGDLQDDAYQRGLEDGKQLGVGMAELREKLEYQRGLKEGKKATWGLVADASSAEYQRGLDDAWEAARKIVKMPDPPYWGVFNEYKDDLFRKITAGEAIEKLKAYEEKQKADDEIKVGDEVRLCRHKVPYIVTSCDGDNGTYILMTVNGGFIKAEKLNVRKTGRHFDISSILKEMQS